MAPPWLVDGVDTVPRRPRSECIKRKRGDAWAAAAKRVKLEDSEEDDQEQEALEALFSLAGGVPDFAAGDQVLAPRAKIEEPSKPVRSMGHASSARPAEGRTQRERRQRSSPRDDDDRDWAPSKEPAVARSSITAPKAVKASTTSTPVGTLSMQVPPASNVGLGTGLGAFAGPFPGNISGSSFGPAVPQAMAAQAPSAAQGGVWPPPAPFLGGIRRNDAPETAGNGQDVLMPPQRRNWKSCASHVYIAHFIEYELHRERLQKQQHQQRIMSRINGADNSQGEGSMNGDHVAASAAPLTERLGSGQQGGGLPGSLPKRVTPLQSSAALQSLAPGNGLGQSVASNPLALPFPQAASMGLGSMQSVGSGQLPQPNGFTPHYAQQLQNQLLMQQGGSFPFLNPGMAPFGRARNGGISAQQLNGFFPPTAHMLSLAGFAALGQQLNGTSNGFAPPKSDMPDGMSTDMGALKRAALASCLKPEDAMKLGLSGPEATNRLHALGVPPGLLSSVRTPGGPMGPPSFHEQLLAATSAQRPESQGVSLMR